MEDSVEPGEENGYTLESDATYNDEKLGSIKDLNCEKEIPTYITDEDTKSHYVLDDIKEEEGNDLLTFV